MTTEYRDGGVVASGKGGARAKMIVSTKYNYGLRKQAGESCPSLLARTLRMAKKKKGIRYWKKKAWDEFSKYIRLRDALKTTGTKETAICYTCKKPYPAFGVGCLQAGHFVPGRGNSILFDERGVHAQCYNCNNNLKGNWPEYMRYMMADYGREVVDELLRLKKQVKIYMPTELEELRDLYKSKFDEMIRGREG